MTWVKVKNILVSQEVTDEMIDEIEEEITLDEEELSEYHECLPTFGIGDKIIGIIASNNNHRPIHLKRGF